MLRKSLDALAEDASAQLDSEHPHQSGTALRDADMRDLLPSIRRSLTAPAQVSNRFVNCRAIATATHVGHSYRNTRPGRDRKISTLAPWQERRAKELLAANLTGSITLAELAAACELSIRHFTRAFRGSTGTSPHAWLLDLRLEKAKQRLTNSRQMLADIALDCGFADQSHMTRAFQRSVGLSPGTWRRLHRR